MSSRRQGARFNRGRLGSGGDAGAAPPAIPVLTAPAGSLIYLTDEVVPWTATTTDVDLTSMKLVLDPGGSETVLDTDASSPYGGNWTVAQAIGAHTLVARATGPGGVTDSAPVSLDIANPTRVTDTFFAAGTWTPPANYVSPAGVRNKSLGACWGGGAGSLIAVGSGGGGAFSSGEHASTPGVGVAIGGIAGGAVDTNGSDTTIGTTLVVAKGGKSATNGSAGGLASECTGTTKFDGGNGTAGSNQAGGGGAGSQASAVGIAGGDPDGGGVNASTAEILTAGGRNNSSIAGARGEVREYYDAPAPADFPRMRAHSAGRDVANVSTRDMVPPAGSGGKLFIAVQSDASAAMTILMPDWVHLGTILDASPTSGLACFMWPHEVDPVASERDIVTSTSQALAWVCHRVHGAGGIEVALATGASGNVDPPSLTPIGGSKKYLWLAVAGDDAAAPINFTAVPANFGGAIMAGGMFSSGAVIMTTQRYFEGSVLDPGTFTNISKQWCAATVAVHPTDPDAVNLTQVVETFIAAGTWTAPADFWGLDGVRNHCRVQCWAGGGGGSTNVGPGGGGAFAQINNFTATPSTGYTIAGIAGGAADTNAGDTTFNTTTCVAKGGLSGTNGGTGGAAASCTGDIAYSGGSNAVGTGTRNGGAGAGSASAGVTTTAGQPDGGLSSDGTLVARTHGSGGGSTPTGQQPGGRGAVRITYDVVGAAGFPRVRGRAGARDTTAPTSRAAELPAGITPGEILLLIVASNGIPTITESGGGWTALPQKDEATGQVSIRAFWKVATGGDTATIDTSTGQLIAQQAYRIADAGTPEWTTAEGNSTNPDCPSHTNSMGSVKGLYIAVAAQDTSIASIVTAVPANYDCFIESPAYASTNGATLLLSRRFLEAASEDPGAYTAGTEQWVAATILIPPA